MGIKYSEGALTLDIYCLLEIMSDADKLALVEVLACDDAVIKRVAEQILDGYTENGSHGPRSLSHEPSTPLSIAIRRTAKLAGEVAKREIEDLERRAAEQARIAEEYSQKYWDLYHQRNQHSV